MTFAPKSIALLLGIALLGCIHKPIFDYEVEPGAPVARFRTVAQDPRELVWQVEGQHPVDPWEFRAAVVKELHQRGFHFVKAEEADLWLDIITMSPAANRSDRAPSILNPNTTQGSARNRSGNGRPVEGSTFGSPGGPVGSGGAAFNATPLEVTAIVKLTSRMDEKPLWTGTVVIPAYRPGSGPQITVAEWIAKLLAPLPGSAKPAPAGAEGSGKP